MSALDITSFVLKWVLFSALFSAWLLGIYALINRARKAMKGKAEKQS